MTQKMYSWPWRRSIYFQTNRLVGLGSPSSAILTLFNAYERMHFFRKALTSWWLFLSAFSLLIKSRHCYVTYFCVTCCFRALHRNLLTFSYPYMVEKILFVSSFQNCICLDVCISLCHPISQSMKDQILYSKPVLHGDAV